MLEIFLHGQLSIILGIFFTLIFLIFIGILTGTDEEEDFWDNALPAVVVGFIIFACWQPILLIIIGIIVVISPVYLGRVIGKWFVNRTKKENKRKSEISKKSSVSKNNNKIILENNPNFSKLKKG